MIRMIRNIWYYYKVHIVIALILLAVAIYLLPQQKTPKPDYDVAIVSPAGCSDDHISSIRTVLAEAGEDQTGDGIVTVKVHVYRFSIGEDRQDGNEIAALDADLVGKVSGFFFVEDPESFEVATNSLALASDAVPVHTVARLSGLGLDEFFLLPRADSEEKYAVMLFALTAY